MGERLISCTLLKHNIETPMMSDKWNLLTTVARRKNIRITNEKKTITVETVRQVMCGELETVTQR